MSAAAPIGATLQVCTNKVSWIRHRAPWHVEACKNVKCWSGRVSENPLRDPPPLVAPGCMRRPPSRGHNPSRNATDSLQDGLRVPKEAAKTAQESQQ
eukprot:9090659-Pyramimonas_sp.AAC.1